MDTRQSERYKFEEVAKIQILEIFYETGQHCYNTMWAFLPADMTCC